MVWSDFIFVSHEATMESSVYTLYFRHKETWPFLCESNIYLINQIVWPIFQYTLRLHSISEWQFWFDFKERSSLVRFPADEMRNTHWFPLTSFRSALLSINCGWLCACAQFSWRPFPQSSVCYGCFQTLNSFVEENKRFPLKNQECFNNRIKVSKEEKQNEKKLKKHVV